MTAQRTPLYDLHVAAGARMTSFGGWSMALHYGSQIAEHHAVRRAAGMFDVSHMTIIDLDGPGALELLARAMANDPAKAVPGRAVYGALLNHDGGVIDDLIVYGRQRGGYRAVVNAATRDRVLDWLASLAADFAATIRERRDLAMLAIQGPDAVAAYAEVTGVDASELAAFATLEDGDWMLARTGYTGEDGVEAMLPAAEAGELWRRLQAAGVVPAGLAARDTLRLEAGLNLYGQDMDETVTPLESNLAWTVAWKPPERAFVGRQALARQRAERPARTLRGIVMEARGVLRHGHRVVSDRGEGVVTSGTFSPTLGYSIGLARLPRGAAGDCSLEISRRSAVGRIVIPPFVRRGKIVFRETDA